MFSICRHGKCDLDDISCVLDVLMTVLIYEVKYVCNVCQTENIYDLQSVFVMVLGLGLTSIMFYSKTKVRGNGHIWDCLLV